MKSKLIAYLFWFLGFGMFGLHRFYLGKFFTGLLWLFTGGFFFVGAFLDFFTLAEQVDTANANNELSQIRTATLINALASLRGNNNENN
ncbi:NINE protein [Leptospira stimsonii]|uniref:NINE protein n=1 Tax=Leptospira stimsonii TaxID=2202203 RepID=A0ABY2N9B4_9LEPT|nr:NINE protein [Leptospira stimsonii]TGK19029.1 NINE protein [Leptospira stimsonii]TGM18958.1 NINE protein [Leptospira stimsonii]